MLDTGDNENALMGCYAALVVGVRVFNDVAPVTGYAPVEGVKYSVIVDVGENQLRFDNVVPNHRRPVATGYDIIFAQPGDECEARVRNNQFSFLIFEGIAPGDCSTP